MRVPPDQSSTLRAKRLSVAATLPAVIHGVSRVSEVLKAKVSVRRATLPSDRTKVSSSRE